MSPWPCIPLKEGRNEKSASDSNSDPHLGKNYGSSNKLGDTSYSRGLQHQGRLYVSSRQSDGGVRLVPGYSVIYESSISDGATIPGPICEPLEPEVTSLHNLAIITSNDECIPSRLAGRGLCLPTICSSGEGIEESSNRQMLTRSC